MSSANDDLDSANMAEVRSIFVDYTKRAGMEKFNYPATDLIKLLILYIGDDLCSSEYYFEDFLDVLKVSQIIWDAINNNIHDSDVSVLKTDDDGWSRYIKYMDAIDWLEGQVIPLAPSRLDIMFIYGKLIIESLSIPRQVSLHTH